MSLLAFLLLVAAGATAEPACGHAQGAGAGIVTIAVAGADVNCKIAVRGEVSGPLAVQVTILPATVSSRATSYSAAWYGQQCRERGAICPRRARECEPYRVAGEERIRPENVNCRP